MWFTLKNVKQPVIAILASEYMLECTIKKFRNLPEHRLNQYQQKNEPIDFNQFFKQDFAKSYLRFQWWFNRFYQL